MSIESDIFKKFVPNYNKLVNYGFIKNKNKFLFEKLFRNDKFKATIIIIDSGEIVGTVYDLENNDEFLPLKIKNYQGAFVGEIRQEYEQILIDIREKCFIENYFISNQANRLTNIIIEKYGDKPEFMWEQAPEYGVFKNPDNNKWYGIIMNIPRSKLGEKNNQIVEIINLKLDKDKIPKLIQNDGFYPAWHMNKKYWISITLDETLADNEIFSLVEESYSYTLKKTKN